MRRSSPSHQPGSGAECGVPSSSSMRFVLNCFSGRCCPVLVTFCRLEELMVSLRSLVPMTLTTTAASATTVTAATTTTTHSTATTVSSTTTPTTTYSLVRFDRSLLLSCLLCRPVNVSVERGTGTDTALAAAAATQDDLHNAPLLLAQLARSSVSDRNSQTPSRHHSPSF